MRQLHKTADFALILENAFQKGQKEKDITLSELMDELTKQLNELIMSEDMVTGIPRKLSNDL